MKTCLLINVDKESVTLIDEFISISNEITLSMKFKNQEETLNYLLGRPAVKVIFLDIGIGDLNWVDFAKNIRRFTQYLVLLSDSDEFINEAFKLRASAYFCKPLKFKNLKKSLERLIFSEDIDSDLVSEDFLFVKNKNHFQFLKLYFKDIISIEAKAHAVKIITLNETIVSNVSFGRLRDKVFFQPNFVQVHKSFIVNSTHMRSVSPSSILMINESVVPIGGKFKSNLYKFVRSKTI